MKDLTKRVLWLVVLTVAVVLTSEQTEAQYRYTFRDSIGVYKVEFTPHDRDSNLAERMGIPLAMGTHELRIGVGHISAVHGGNYTSDAWYPWYPSETYGPEVSPGWGVASPQWITLNGEYGYWLKDWLYIGGSAAWTMGFAKCYDMATLERLSTYNYNSISIMPEVRFAWLRRGIVQLYSGIGLGIQATIDEGVYGKRNYFDMAYDVTFFGISVGRKWFCYFDIGAGSRGALSLGLGYRFNKAK